MKPNNKTNLSLIAFQEDKVYILFSPALDLYGYGNTVGVITKFKYFIY